MVKTRSMASQPISLLLRFPSQREPLREDSLLVEITEGAGQLRIFRGYFS
jgi:hypothetical protein